MSRRIAFIAAAAALLAGVAVTAAAASSRKPANRASSHLLVGINDEADTLYPPNILTAFQTLLSLKTQVLRVNLYWGGTKWAVANKKPVDPRTRATLPTTGRCTTGSRDTRTTTTSR